MTRLTGVYAYVILFHMTLFRGLKNGPLMSWFIPKVVQVCQDSWWKNILYITNIRLPNEEEADVTITVSFIFLQQLPS